eukprot:gene16387-16204_t
MSASLVLDGLTGLLRDAAGEAQAFVAEAKGAVKAKITAGGRIDRKLADDEQHRVHGFGWYASYAELMTQVAGWASALEAAGKFSETDALLAQLLFAEYANQLIGGIPMNQGEMIRPWDLTADQATVQKLFAPALSRCINEGGGQAVKSRVAQLVAQARGKATVEDTGLDETFEMIRDQFHGFAEEKVIPFAHQWHLNDELIPLELVTELGDLGVFGLTIPEEYGGSGMGKTAMCVVSEELSRAWIGVGSLATRSEIAPDTTDYRGLSMLLAPKLRGDEAGPFPTPGMSGGEIGVIGYRGMKEYEIGFDGFAVPAANLLGGTPGQGFKQLMATFESARIQTAARAVGVAQRGLELGLNYALDRKQFGGPIFGFPRVANKLAMMAAELMGVR